MRLKLYHLHFIDEETPSARSYNFGQDDSCRERGSRISLAPDPEGEGNGTPLQYSCLENPRDGGA